MWQSVREELQTFWHILPMIESDWVLPWNTYVIVTDASNTGFGECTGVWARRDVVRHGRVQERSRSESAPSLPGLTHWLSWTILSRMQAGV